LFAFPLFGSVKGGVEEKGKGGGNPEGKIPVAVFTSHPCGGQGWKKREEGV